MSGASAAPTVEQIISAVRDLTNTRWTIAAAATLSIYDWMLVFSDEIETIWISSWTLPKALYYFIRIATIPCIMFSAYHLSDFRPPMTRTLIWLILPSTVNLLVSASCNWLFTLRLIALYRASTSLVWFMKIGFTLTWSATTIILGFALHSYDSQISFISELNVCGTSLITKTMPAIFYAPLAWEFFIFAFTAYRAYKDAALITVARGHGAPFLIILYRDGLISFVVMVCARVWNIWIFTTQPVTTFSLGTYLMWTGNTIMTLRVYLNLVWLVKRPNGLSENQTRKSGRLSNPVAGTDTYSNGGTTGRGKRMGTISWGKARNGGSGTGINSDGERVLRIGRGMNLGLSGGGDRDSDKDTYVYRVSKWDEDSLMELNTIPSAVPHSPSLSQP